MPLTWVFCQVTHAALCTRTALGCEESVHCWPSASGAIPRWMGRAWIIHWTDLILATVAELNLLPIKMGKLIIVENYCED